MPGQSRSLLQIKQEFDAGMGDLASNKNDIVKAEPTSVVVDGMAAKFGDHDYSTVIAMENNRKNRKLAVGATNHNGHVNSVVSYIEEDAPPEGYGPGKVAQVCVQVNYANRPGLKNHELYVFVGGATVKS